MNIYCVNGSSTSSIMGFSKKLKKGLENSLDEKYLEVTMISSLPAVFST